MESVIDLIVKKAEEVKAGRDPVVRPGAPERISEAVSIGDFGWQGDLKLTVVDDKVPGGYHLVANPQEKDLQLVPGNTEGARHCLASFNGVELYHPDVWTEESLDGPFIRLVGDADVDVLHPTHGKVSIPPLSRNGMACLVTYQRELDRELKIERRSRD